MLFRSIQDGMWALQSPGTGLGRQIALRERHGFFAIRGLKGH